jgi:hypothetical protein
MKFLELITLSLDLVGLGLISWYLFSIPKSVDLEPRDEGQIATLYFGVTPSRKPIEDAINNIIPSIELVRKMRIGLGILIMSLLLKILLWYLLHWYCSP